MLVLKLCEQFCPEKIPYKIGHRLGDGVDGEVFSIEGQPDKVIKFGVLFQSTLDIETNYKSISQVLEHLIQYPVDVFAKVHSQQYMGCFSRKALDSNQEWYQQDFILYHYLMDKLYPISEDERKVFWSLICHNDSGINKNYSIATMKKMIFEMAKWLDFDVERLTFFCENYRNSSVKHLDVHVRNIMKDVNGNFKLIDFERSEIKE